MGWVLLGEGRRATHGDDIIVTLAESLESADTGVQFIYFSSSRTRKAKQVEKTRYTHLSLYRWTRGGCCGKAGMG